MKTCDIYFCLRRILVIFFGEIRDMIENEVLLLIFNGVRGCRSTFCTSSGFHKCHSIALRGIGRAVDVLNFRGMTTL